MSQDFQKNQFFSNLIQGLAASKLLFTAIKTTIMAPFHFIETRYQTMGQMKRNGLINQYYKGYLDCAQSAIKQQGGISALFKGNLAKILNATTGSIFSLTMGLYTKRAIIQTGKNYNNQQVLHSNILGNIGGLIASYGAFFITYPFQYAYVRLVTNKQFVNLNNNQKQFKGIIDVVSQTYKLDGIRGLYRGIFTNFTGLIGYRAFYFSLYYISASFAQFFNINSIYLKFLMGYTITILAGAFIYPLSTIRRRMMMRSMTPQKYKWSGQCFWYVLKNQGFLSLYRGFPIHLFTSILSVFALTLIDNFIHEQNNYYQ